MRKEELKNTKVRALATAALVTITWSHALNAMAQGLIGAPVDTRCGYAGGSEVGNWFDFGYDTARDVSRIITGITFLITFFVPLAKHKKSNLKRCFWEFVGLALIPFFVHLCGTFAINNYGGLTSGL